MPPTSRRPDRNLALELVRVTESAALAASRWVGRGDKNGADGAAVAAMRTVLSTVTMDGVVVIGEGEKDDAPMLFNGEQVGDGSPPLVDVAVDPIDGTTLTAQGRTNALSVIAVSDRESMFDPGPSYYMEKIAVGPEAVGSIDITASPTQNLRWIAKAKRESVRDLTVVILDRPRHAELIDSIRGAGARIKLISDGDLSAAVSCAVMGTGVHAVMGIGGAPEGVLTAAALRCLGGEIQARLRFRNDEERARAERMGTSSDEERVYSTTDLAPGENLVFSATGVTEGDLLNGVRFFGGGARTHSLVMGYQSKQVRFVDTVHMFDRDRPPSVRL